MAALVLWAVGWLLLINIATYATFAHDKRAAARGDGRIPENTLLLMALAGGSVGALSARRRLRHKTRKQPFSATLYLIVGVQLLLMVALVWAGVHGAFGAAAAKLG